MVRSQRRKAFLVAAKTRYRENAIIGQKRETTNQVNFSPGLPNDFKKCRVKLQRIKLPIACVVSCLGSTRVDANNAEPLAGNSKSLVRPFKVKLRRFKLPPAVDVTKSSVCGQENPDSRKILRRCVIRLRRCKMQPMDPTAANKLDGLNSTCAQASTVEISAGNLENLQQSANNAVSSSGIRSSGQNQHPNERIRRFRIVLHPTTKDTYNPDAIAMSDRQNFPDDLTADNQNGVGINAEPLPLVNIKALKSDSILRKKTKRQEAPNTRKFVKYLNQEGKKNSDPENNNNVDYVYDFLSESQNSGYIDEHLDPAADIVQRMIKDGKVRVATIRKGSGKPILKYNAKAKKKPKATLKKPVKTGKNKLTVSAPKKAKQAENSKTQILSEQSADPSRAENPASASNENYKQTEPTDGRAMSPVRHSEGGFSELARSVLVQQLRKQKQQLLQMAKKFVSTPLHKSVAPPLPHAENMSPIAANEGTRPNKSLWGADSPNEGPSTSANAGLWTASSVESESHEVENAPACRIASPIIPSLPQIDEESMDGHASPSYSPPQSPSALQYSPLPASLSPPGTFERRPGGGNASPWRITEDTQLPALFNFTLNPQNVPSFSSDFLPASPKKKNQNKEQEEELPNACASISSHRQADFGASISSCGSNDSNAENVPPIRADADASSNSDANADIFNRHENPNPRQKLSNRSPLKTINILEVVTFPPPKHQSVINKSKSPSSAGLLNCNIEKESSGLFGFDELIDASNEPPPITETPQIRYAQKSLHDKLVNLKKWRPVREEMAISATARVAPVFDDNLGRPKMRTVKEMLTSTMKESAQPTNVANLSDLFKDPDPETTFDEKSAHRTYIRTIKKKRKFRENVVMFFDSDDSGEEEGHQETSPTKKTSPKKRPKKVDPKIATELEEFARSFNEMCDEVDKFELMVEKA